MKITQVGVFPATAALVLTSTYGYSFIDGNPVKDQKDPTSLSINKESHIYGGTEADIGQYPFLANLRDSYLSAATCSGTLIAPLYILTAARCTMIEDLVATFGTNHSILSDQEDDVRVRVVKKYRHPLHSQDTHLYDVGLLKLEKPVRRKPAKLCARDGSDNMPGTMATTLGWGQTEDVSISPTLKQVTLPIISNAECNKFEKLAGRVEDCMLCAGRGNGKDTCYGDAGGPLLVNDDILVGFTSWGSDCGKQAGIFTRLSYVMDYIDDILAGGDGSKFDVESSDSPMQEELPFSSSSKTDFDNLLDKDTLAFLTKVGGSPDGFDQYLETGTDDDGDSDELDDANDDKPTKMPGAFKLSKTPSDASSVLKSAEQAYLAKEGKAKISLESSEATVDEPYSPNTENSVLQSVVQSDMNP
ncbi:unnamed protein product [Peronospora belbahrii]|uniref:Peptidase S1 domain-containing protein n=1 Tax=Peronospora belbahrii TaxID=622444 RepID=A0AAU9L7J9_9STRA|nr:unnamed protein product [Peronospora belbahrii]CAH0522210.1 unnamed protein product [Peronospora belbahrii]